MDDRPRNLKAMLSEAKDSSELMVDLAYAALFYGDDDMADEVLELESTLSDLVHEMRGICVMAARSPRDADAMSSVLHLVSAIERMGNAAVDVAKIVTHHLGIPKALIADLAAAHEVSHRVRVREASALDGHSLEALELPVETGFRLVAIRRAKKDWIVDPDGDEVLRAGDVLIARGPSDGIPELRELAGAPEWRTANLEEVTAISDLDRAVDVLVDMKNISEAAVALAYSALIYRDSGLAAEVIALEDRLDEMREHLEVWVLRAAAETVDPSHLRGLLHLGAAAEEIGDAAQQMVWLVEKDEELHPVLQVALGDTDDVVFRVPIAAGSALDGAAVTMQLGDDTGFVLLALRRGGRYAFRPRPGLELRAGDELLARGPWEGRDDLAEQCGYRLVDDEDTGEIELLPIAGS